MSSLAYLILFSAIAFSALIAVSIANERDRRAKLIRQKLKSIKRKVDALEELVIEIDLLVESRVISKLINDEIIDLLQQMTGLDSNANYLQASLINAEKRGEELATESSSHTLNRVRESDSQIAKAQYQLGQASQVLKRQHSLGKVSLEELNVFLSQLNWAYLMVDVISHITQGHKAIQRSDILTAHAFYKRSQQTLMQSNHTDPRRHRFIKELSEILSNRRKALSLDLMPEAEFNPADPTSPESGQDHTASSETA